MTALVPDSYTISHFTPTQAGNRQANIFLTARANANKTFSLVGRPRYFEDTVQEWMINKHVGGYKQLFSIRNVATGHFLSRSKNSSDGSGPSLELSDVQHYWRMSCVDMSYTITSESEDSETLQVHVPGKPQNSDDSQIHLLPSSVSAGPQPRSFHLWTLIPTFRGIESPEAQPVPKFPSQPLLPIPIIQTPPPPPPQSTPSFSGTFYIKHPSSGLALDLYYSLKADNTPVTLEEANGGPGQVWRIMKKPQTEGEKLRNEEDNQGYYWVQCVSSGTYLSGRGFVTGNAEPQDWVVEAIGDSEYPYIRLLEAGTGLAIDVADGQMIEGTKVRSSGASLRSSDAALFSRTNKV
ncbi:hypothetical protein M407DRAFT_17894 [Tulasnella calospora MUT 4182]|uniref:Ricin B lectin domain-containing protein n=1 Tax=Tulasnella calospora MUT 4182 TaxID=1051891 RepID=A0A0C3QWQ3_9AGAM|nr:hypothetical protein M407DRAFT_17894 [Tulasnella calospora MUT 4182]